MSNWKNTLNLVPYFHNDDLTLEEKTKDIILVIKSRPWFNEDLYYFQEFENLLEELSDAGEADDVEWFDTVWSAMYDIFDGERIWVKTR